MEAGGGTSETPMDYQALFTPEDNMMIFHLVGTVIESSAYEKKPNKTVVM